MDSITFIIQQHKEKLRTELVGVVLETRGETMYTIRNYKSKKELVADYTAGVKIPVFQPNAEMFGKDPFNNPDGRACIEGPHYPQPHKFYIAVEIRDNIIYKIDGVKFKE